MLLLAPFHGGNWGVEGFHTGSGSLGIVSLMVNAGAPALNPGTALFRSKQNLLPRKHLPRHCKSLPSAPFSGDPCMANPFLLTQLCPNKMWKQSIDANCPGHSHAAALHPLMTQKSPPLEFQMPSFLWLAPCGMLITVTLAKGVCQSSEGRFMVRLIYCPPNPMEYKFIKVLAWCLAQSRESMHSSPFPWSFFFNLGRVDWTMRRGRFKGKVRSGCTSHGADLCCVTSLRELTCEGHAQGLESTTWVCGLLHGPRMLGSPYWIYITSFAHVCSFFKRNEV